MNKKKAISILTKQIDKLKDSNYHKDETWIFHTASYIKTFFGENSTEYDFISKFSFTVTAFSGESDTIVMNRLNNQKLKAERFLENCMEVLEVKGLYKEEGKFKKWFKEPENWWKILVFIVGTSISVASIIFASRK